MADHPIEKWAKDLYRRIAKEDIQIDKEHMKGCSISIVIKKMQIMSIMQCYYTPIRMAKMKKTNSAKCWQNFHIQLVGM